jgi:hypothetical protein
MTLLLVAAAFAVDIAPIVGVAPRACDELGNNLVAGLSGGVALAERFAVESRIAFRVGLPDDNWKPITDQMVNETGRCGRAVPAIVQWNGLGNATLTFVPLDGTVGERSFTVRLSVGSGLARTRDDLKALQAEDEPEAVATERQWHPTLDLGAALRVELSERASLQLSVAHAGWIETIDGTDLEKSGAWLLTASPVFHVRRQPKPCGEEEPCEGS